MGKMEIERFSTNDEKFSDEYDLKVPEIITYDNGIPLFEEFKLDFTEDGKCVLYVQKY